MGASEHRPGRGPGTQQTDLLEAIDAPWVTIVWDDPVNLMNYVTFVFQKLFGYSEPQATKLMLQVHNEGKAVVSSGSREDMEVGVTKLHGAGAVGDHAAGPLSRRRDDTCVSGNGWTPPRVPASSRRWSATRSSC